MRVLFIADVVGKPGRRGLAAVMPALREQHLPDLVIVNGENAAGGLGITKQTAEEIYAAGADVITLGNHAFRKPESYGFLNSEKRIVRPANYAEGNPGRGQTIVEAAGMRVAVVNLIGSVQLDAARPPFPHADEIVSALEGAADAILVDFHAEVTSEKVAMGWHLDGRVAAVIGTHTHVPTADARVLPGGTAFLCDAGMTGARASVLGVRADQVIERFMTGMPIRFETADRDVWVMGAAIEVGDDGLARSIEQVLVPAED